MNQLAIDFENHAPAADKTRLSRQCETILAMLRERPRSNVELNAIAYRFSARIFELRRAGFRIKSTRLEDGVWSFELVEERG